MSVLMTLDEALSTASWVTLARAPRGAEGSGGSRAASGWEVQGGVQGGKGRVECLAGLELVASWVARLTGIKSPEPVVSLFHRRSRRKLRWSQEVSTTSWTLAEPADDRPQRLQPSPSKVSPPRLQRQVQHPSFSNATPELTPVLRNSHLNLATRTTCRDSTDRRDSERVPERADRERGGARDSTREREEQLRRQLKEDQRRREEQRSSHGEEKVREPLLV